MHRNKVNKGCKCPLQGELQATEERLKKTTEGGKTAHAHGLAEST
jgi:hypothetical protein